ncbi:phosphotransferase family protein [Sphingobium scionense]
MRREARLLRAIAGTNVPHPALIADCGDESVLGVAFYLMEPVDGFNPVGQLPMPHAGSPAMRHAMGLALVDGIAALGALDHQALGLADFGRPDNFLLPGRSLAQPACRLWRICRLDRTAGAAQRRSHRRLAGTAPPGRFHPGIMHGDYHLANVMYRPDSGDLAAIIDWELATIGDPLLDLGWVLATWPDGSGASTVSVTPWEGFPTPAELVARYGAGSARDLSAVDWYHVLACYKLGILLEGTHARACAGKAPRDTGDRLHSRAIHLFDRAQALIR